MKYYSVRQMLVDPTTNEIDFFEEMLEDYMELGWELHGGLQITSHKGELLYSQAFVRDAEDNE